MLNYIIHDTEHKHPLLVPAYDAEHAQERYLDYRASFGQSTGNLRIYMER